MLQQGSVDLQDTGTGSQESEEGNEEGCCDVTCSSEA